MTGGHLFIVDGDITSITCDAWLVPSDQRLKVTSHFAKQVGLPTTGHLQIAGWSGWSDQGMFLLREGSDGEPSIWLGDIGRPGNAPISHFGNRADSFVHLASQHARSHRSDLSRRPLLALPVLGSDAGGMRARRGELLEELITRCASSAHQAGADVVLVCFGQVMTSAAQIVRSRLMRQDAHFRSISGWNDLEQNLWEEAERLGQLAEQGELVVFLGAGTSIDAGIPGWDDLLKGVAKEAGLDEAWEELSDFDARDKATIIERKLGARFASIVSEHTDVARYGLIHGLLATLPTKEHVTTNFDVLFEKAASTAGRHLAVIPGDEVRLGERWLLKLHGTLGGDLVFTRSEYLASVSAHSALRGIVQAMLLTRHMLFVGYSLRDEDFHQLVHEVRSALGQNARNFGTALFVSANEHTSTLWPEIQIVTTGAGAEAGRRVSLFLDMVASHAASEIAFIADPSFRELRNDHEDRLQQIVSDLHALHRDAHGDRTGESDPWPEVTAFLKHFRRHGD